MKETLAAIDDEYKDNLNNLNTITEGKEKLGLSYLLNLISLAITHIQSKNIPFFASYLC